MARQQWTTSSFSLPRQLHDRLKRVTRYGDRSRVVVKLLEMWLAGEIHITDRPHPTVNVAQSNTTVQPPNDWQTP